VNTQQRERFEKGNTFGVGRVDQFAWKALFDSFSCTECGRCADVCPATSTGKSLNPKTVIHDLKVNLQANAQHISLNGSGNGHAVPLIGGGGEGSVSEDTIWACTTCGACMEVCPVFIEHVPKIVDMRRNMVEMKAQFPDTLLAVFESVELRSNPWGIAPSERANWAKDITAEPFEAGKTEYLFYVGCAGAFDARSRHVTMATTKLLSAAGISWGILETAEPCCGDSLRRLGNEYVFEQLAAKNVALLKEKGVKKIVAQCPHCFSTLKNDYRQYGLEADVVHHTELINSLIEGGRLSLQKAGDLGRVVFHDSCYLGRYNAVFDAPRKAITAATGEAPVEMGRHRENGFCCGAGGGRMWMEEDSAEHINVVRAGEAMREKPDTICVSCPYCMTMYEDALKDKFAGQEVRVLDLAEVVARAMA
jgi:Fe-S oxidoreductase